MGIVKRKMQKENMLFRKRFKMSIKHISEIMLPEFSDADFYTDFKKYFPYMWEDICKHYANIQRDNVRRKKRGLSTNAFPKPDKFLQDISSSSIAKTRRMHLNGIYLSNDEREARICKLERKAKKKIEERAKKEAENTKYIQEVCPPYVKALIQDYYQQRKLNTLDVNSRYLIILEAAQFKSTETVRFLHQINACDKNTDLRLLAFHKLQQLGENPRLARQRKGKKRMSITKCVDISHNPTELLKMIYARQQNLYTYYDVFLSHSSYDEKELIEIKSTLNKKGLVVYIDWVNDRVMLNRQNQNGDTKKVLMKRMDMSDKMLFVMTDNSLKSEWTPWEIDYFTRKGGKVFIYQPYAISESVPDNIKDKEKISNNDWNKLIESK